MLEKLTDIRKKNGIPASTKIKALCRWISDLTIRKTKYKVPERRK
jgi:hypothetical protein